MTEAKLRVEQIRCPKCERIQPGIVAFPVWPPFAIYYKVCICGYIITESEWCVVDGVKAMEGGSHGV